MNSYGQAHELANLYVAGCGIFPTESSANPTFTLNALSLRGAEQLAKGPGAEAQLPQDDGGPTVAEDFGCFGDGTELGVGDHGASMYPPAPSVQVRFTYLYGGTWPSRWQASDHNRRKSCALLRKPSAPPSR